MICMSHVRVPSAPPAHVPTAAFITIPSIFLGTVINVPSHTQNRLTPKRTTFKASQVSFLVSVVSFVNSLWCTVDYLAPSTASVSTESAITTAAARRFWLQWQFRPPIFHIIQDHKRRRIHPTTYSNWKAIDGLFSASDTALLDLYVPDLSRYFCILSLVYLSDSRWPEPHCITLVYHCPCHPTTPVFSS